MLDQLLNGVLPVFGIGALGYVFGLRRTFDFNMAMALNKFVMFVAMPALGFQRLIPFTPVLHDVEFSALQGARVPVLFCSCQPVGKPIDRCPVKRSTRAFTTRTRVRSIWRTGAGRRASSAPLAAPAKAGP